MQRRQVNRTNRSRDIILPAPIYGWNCRDSLSAMKPLFAITMDNYIPLDSKISIRPGYTAYVKLGTEENPVKVETVVGYQKPGNNRMLAIAGGKAYDISSKVNIHMFDDVVFSDNRCQTVQYKDRLFLMNGQDTPKVFYIDETNDRVLQDWGFTSESLQAGRIIAGAVSHEFLWFVEKNTLKAWYAAEAGNIAGNLYSFDLSQISKFGGELMAVANWTVDGGAGLDDLTCFITSEGEVLVYRGYNPNSADNWELVGSYKMSKPIGYQCTLQYQGDVIIICEDGYIPLSKALSMGNAMQSAVAFSDAIRGAVLERTAANRYSDGWQGIIYSRKGYAIFNVPVYQQFEQHVININTGAWCRFTNIRSYCWGMFDNRLYFGADNYVYLFDEGYSDNGQEIKGEIAQAYNNLGSDSLKKIQLLNPRTKSSTGYTLVIYANMDFEERDVDYYANIGLSGMTKWNTAPWSSSNNPVGTKWATSKTSRIFNQWLADSATGFKASIVFKTQTKGNIIEWFDTGVRFEDGNGIM